MDSIKADLLDFGDILYANRQMQPILTPTEQVAFDVASYSLLQIVKSVTTYMRHPTLTQGLHTDLVILSFESRTRSTLIFVTCLTMMLISLYVNLVLTKVT